MGDQSKDIILSIRGMSKSFGRNRVLDHINLDVEYIGGDGQTESNITNRLGNPSQYDAFAINMVKTDNAASYTALLQ